MKSDDPFNYAWRGRVQQSLGNNLEAEKDFESVKTYLGGKAKAAYVVAQGFAHYGQIQQTYEFLRIAFVTDKNLIDQVQSDEEFNLIRNQDEFLLLIERVQSMKIDSAAESVRL